MTRYKAKAIIKHIFEKNPMCTRLKHKPIRKGFFIENGKEVVRPVLFIKPINGTFPESVKAFVITRPNHEHPSA